MLQALRNRLGTMLGYDAIVDKGKRRQASVRSVSEDRELQQSGRNQLNANARDQVRNFAVAAWAVRKHLDFVSRFNFDCSSGNDAFDVQIEKLMEDASATGNWDIAGRHDRERWLRLFEARACVDGDILGVKLKSGHLQAIESDRIRSKEHIDSEKIVQGVRLNAAGKALGYQIHARRHLGGFDFEREVKAENVVHHGYFDRFDQVRGISPMAPGLNSLQDVYENFDYALAKMKISQLFGLKFTRDADESPAPISETVSEEKSDTGPRYDIHFGNKPVLLDLDPGDDADILESRTPSNEFQSFTEAIIQVALKALDIPYCFFDESHTNFYGSRAAVTLYIEACKMKRHFLELVLRDITNWKIRQWVVAGKLKLPAGMTVDTVPYTWIHAGLPWWDPVKEINAANQEVRGGFNSRRRIRKEKYGDDWFKIVDELAEEQQYAASKGVLLESALLPEPAADDTAASETPKKRPAKSQSKPQAGDRPAKKKKTGAAA